MILDMCLCAVTGITSMYVKIEELLVFFPAPLLQGSGFMDQLKALLMKLVDVISLRSIIS